MYRRRERGRWPWSTCSPPEATAHTCISSQRIHRRMSRQLKHPVPDAHLARIGDITVSFALLENSVQSLMGSLLNEHQRVGQIIAAELSFTRIKATAKERDGL